MTDKKSSPESNSLYRNSEEDDFILKDFRSHRHPFKCDTCSVGLENRKAYEQHMNGKKHQKMVNTMKAKTKVVELNGNKSSNSASDEEETGEELECDACQIKFSGHIPYYSHMKSKKHAKKLVKLKLKEQMKDMPEILKNAEDEDNEEDLLLPKAIARCEPCQKVFYCPESFHQHMKSLLHKKKSQQKILAGNISSQTHDGENGENDYRCDICAKNFSGPVPYTDHMKSPIHEKEVNRFKAASQVKHLCKDSDDKHFFICKDCDKKFTNPLALLEHVNSNDHQKEEAKKEVMKFLSQHSEIKLAKVIETAISDEEAESDEEEASDVMLLICKLCNVSLAGPESAKQHVASNKHISLKKQKKILKQIKQQKARQNSNDEGPKNPDKGTDHTTGSKSNLPPKKSTTADDDGFEMI